jgi:hypothetical protein
MINPRTYGFSKTDAEELLQVIGNGDAEYAEMKPRGKTGSGESSRLFRFTLNASLASGTADADILLMNGTDTGIDATVRDPLGIFASLTAVNSPGLCLRQDGLYYVIQAACPV